MEGGKIRDENGNRPRISTGSAAFVCVWQIYTTQCTKFSVKLSVEKSPTTMRILCANTGKEKEGLCATVIVTANR